MRTRYANTAKSKAPRTGEDIRTFSERKLTEAEIREVDEKLARFCYSEGLPLKALANKELRGGLRPDTPQLPAQLRQLYRDVATPTVVSTRRTPPTLFVRSHFTISHFTVNSHVK